MTLHGLPLKTYQQHNKIDILKDEETEIQRGSTNCQRSILLMCHFFQEAFLDSPKAIQTFPCHLVPLFKCISVYQFAFHLAQFPEEEVCLIHF